MTSHIVADFIVPMRYARKSGLVAAALAAIVASMSSVATRAENRADPRPVEQVIASTVVSPATDSAAAARPRSAHGGENHQLFFGFLEFDWNPNAPGGVPGFGSLPVPTHLANP